LNKSQTRRQELLAVGRRLEGWLSFIEGRLDPDALV
jgi:hypothetical protein